jgi:O-glycosyl hydrolase
MVSVKSSSGDQYVVTPYYYLIKHFSKHVDAGYHRVETTSTNASLLSSAFISPDNKKLTLIIINNGTATLEVELGATGKTIVSISADQSKEGSYYKPITIGSVTDKVSLPAKSITTVVLGI